MPPVWVYMLQDMKYDDLVALRRHQLEVLRVIYTYTPYDLQQQKASAIPQEKVAAINLESQSLSEALDALDVAIRQHPQHVPNKEWR